MRLPATSTVTICSCFGPTCTLRGAATEFRRILPFSPRSSPGTPDRFPGRGRYQVAGEDDRPPDEDQREHHVVLLPRACVLDEESERHDAEHAEHRRFTNARFPTVEEEEEKP